MLASEDAEAREAGGAIAAFAALEWDRPDLMQQALSGDRHVRKGLAETTAGRVHRTSNAVLATETLIRLMNDDADEVRKEAAAVVLRLREQPLQPFVQLLTALIDSPAYVHATPQLLLTLKDAPDKVDELVLSASQRFLDVFGNDAADIRTGAAGDAHYISELAVTHLRRDAHRGLWPARTAKYSSAPGGVLRGEAAGDTHSSLRKCSYAGGMSTSVKYEFESASKAHAAVAEVEDHGITLHVQEVGMGAVVEVPTALEEAVEVMLIRHGGTEVIVEKPKGDETPREPEASVLPEV